MIEQQTTNSILMVSPASFDYNEQTAANNFYQKLDKSFSGHAGQQQAMRQFEDFVNKLCASGITVHVIDDLAEPVTPDAVFPNNWISFHEDGRVVFYPMYAKNRRPERRDDIPEYLRDKGYHFREKVDLSFFEKDEIFLEGTGSMVLDRENRIAYAAYSPRTHKRALEEFCRRFNYRPMAFHALQPVEKSREAIYHTNVMMYVGKRFSFICLDAIDDPNEKESVIDSLSSSGKEIVPLAETQLLDFAGNMLEVKDGNGRPVTVMSSAAYHSLSREQRAKIEQYSPIVHSDLSVIETLGGGSARCMMAEIFLPQDAGHE